MTSIHSRAGRPARPDDLVDVAKLVAAYYQLRPDPSASAQRVVFGTSGHRGSSLDASFNEAHVLAISQAICMYRRLHRIDGPLFIGIDTHALSVPAFESALEVLAANHVEVRVAQGDEYTPTPVVSHAILVHNRGRISGLADGIVVTPSHNPPELCSWDNDEGLVSYRRSLSDSHPDRLYIWEFTARGPNAWQDMWYEAREDINHCVCIFIGWWAHDGQKIQRDTRDWEFYGVQPATAEEQKKIARVKELYDFEITQEQLAWYRRLVDPASRDSGDTDAGFEANQFQKQEDPWDEDEAFQITGSVFFSGESLKDQSEKYVSNKYKSYMFMPGTEFCDLKVYPAETSRNIELKVWQPPEREAVYSIGIDPAFGENENNDRSAFQIFRCYSDGIDQVAEYAYPLISTKHFAWVIAAVMGWYGAEPLTEISYILEINGPGGAVLDELKGLKFQIENSYSPLAEQGIRNIFANVRQYIHQRPDSMSGGSGAWHWKTQTQNKVMILEKLRSMIQNGQLHVHSQDLIREMQRIARDGDTIKASGTGDAGKDDRTLAAALCVHNWDVKIRRNLIVQKRSREAEKVKKMRSVVDQTQLFNQNMMSAFMGQKQQSRIQSQRLAMKNAWRYGGRR